MFCTNHLRDTGGLQYNAALKEIHSARTLLPGPEQRLDPAEIQNARECIIKSVFNRFVSDYSLLDNV